VVPKGSATLRFLFLVGGLVAFAVLYAYFIYEIWTASDNTTPDLDKQLVYMASALGGVLGTFFAVALGIQRKDPNVDQRDLKLGSTLLGTTGPSEALATAALWLYAAVGLAAGVTAILKSVESPDAIKALAAVFGGYGFAVFSAAFTATNPSPGPPTPPGPPAPRA
jgi:hypothetical protein